MDIGTLRNRITIQRPAETFDAIGQPVAGWAIVAAVWADVHFLSGLEAIKADGPVNAIKASVRIRYRADVTGSMRVLLSTGQLLDVRAVLPDVARREFVDLVCESGQNNG